jgi:hypothetical protein
MDWAEQVIAVVIAFLAVLTFAAMIWAGQHQS